MGCTQIGKVSQLHVGHRLNRAQTCLCSLLMELPLVKSKQNDLIVERFDKLWVLDRVNVLGQVLPSTRISVLCRVPASVGTTIPPRA